MLVTSPMSVTYVHAEFSPNMLAIFGSKLKISVLCPLQSLSSHWDSSSALLLVRVEPTQK